MIEMKGFDELRKTLADAQKALEGLDGDLGQVRFDPADPASIEAAIAEAERIIDERIGSYAANPIVSQISEGLKQNYRTGIIDRAAAARLEGGRTDV